MAQQPVKKLGTWRILGSAMADQVLDADMTLAIGLHKLGKAVE